MKIPTFIFLDIDGPCLSVNHRKRLKENGKSTAPQNIEFEKSILDLIHNVIVETNAKIILSSTWRFGLDVKENVQLDPQHKNLIEQFALSGLAISDCTPIRDDGCRGKEILEFLETYASDHNINKDNIAYIVIDDDSWDIDPYIHPAYFIEVDGVVGFTKNDSDFAIYSLNKQRKIINRRLLDE